MKKYKSLIVYLFTGSLIVSGLLLIFIPLNTLPHIHTLTKEPAELSAIIEALHAASPTPQQIKLAARMLEMQKDSLATLGSAADDASRGLEYCGILLLLSGIVWLVSGRKPE